MQKITPFLWFNNNAEEAMNFYVSIFKNSRIVSLKRYPEGPLEGPMKGMEGKVLTAVFELEGQRFMALDGGPFFKPSGAVSFYVECETQEEVDDYWEKLTAGGNPKAQQCGWLQDKYGFSWQIIPAALPKRSRSRQGQSRHAGDASDEEDRYRRSDAGIGGAAGLAAGDGSAPLPFPRGLFFPASVGPHEPLAVFGEFDRNLAHARHERGVRNSHEKSVQRIRVVLDHQLIA